jgi:hypothetical protein
MHRTVDSRQPAMNEGLALAGIQVAPTSFLGMIMEWTPFDTMRAFPDDALDLLDPDIDTILFQIQGSLTTICWSHPLESVKNLFNNQLVGVARPPFENK